MYQKIAFKRPQSTHTKALTHAVNRAPVYGNDVGINQKITEDAKGFALGSRVYRIEGASLWKM